MSLELLSIPREDVELGNDIKEAAPHALGSGNVSVQLVFAAQLPSSRKVIGLHMYNTQCSVRTLTHMTQHRKLHAVFCMRHDGWLTQAPFGVWSW